MKTFLFLIATLISFASAAEGPTFLSNVKSDFVSPWTDTTARYVLLSGTGLTTLLVFNKAQTSGPLQDKWSEQKPLGKTSKIGNFYGEVWPNAFYTVGMLGHYKMSDSTSSLMMGQTMAEATIFASFWSTIMKFSLREKRPDPSTNRQSFPSGHTTMAFAFASVVGANHGWMLGVPAYMMAAFTGLSRMNDNAHYLNDVVAGATLGTAYGLGVASNLQKNNEKKSNTSWLVVPCADGEALGLIAQRAW